MVRWTEGPATDEEEVGRISLGQRLRAHFIDEEGNAGAAFGLLRAGLAIVVVVAVVFAILRLREVSEARVDAVKAPVFAKLPAVVAPPVPVPPQGPIALPASPPILQRLSPLSPVIDYVQGFSDRDARPGAFCRALRDLGFSKARWAVSPVYAAEWECASALSVDGAGEGLGFAVLRGTNASTKSSLMLKLNPATPDQREGLKGVARSVVEAAGILLGPSTYRELDDWEPSSGATASGRFRFIAEYNQPDRRVMTVTFDPTLDRPSSTLCGTDCGRWLAALARVPERTSVTTVSR